MEIERRIEALLQSDKDRILIAIDGRTGSGKSSLAKKLAEEFFCNLFHMDDFFLQGFQRTEERRKEIGGNVDYERFQREVLLPLKNKETVLYQPFHCQTMQLQEKVEMPFRRLNLIEGSYAQHPYFSDPYDLKIFVDIDQDLQLSRIAKRNWSSLRRFGFRKRKPILQSFRLPSTRISCCPWTIFKTCFLSKEAEP